MPLLDDLFSMLGAGQPMPAQGRMPPPSRGVPMGMTPPQAEGPLPPPETEPTAPAKRVARPDFNEGHSEMGTVLQGLFGDGVIGGLGKAMSANAQHGAQVERKNQTYDWLVNSKGVDSETARMIVTNPDAAKVLLPRLLGVGMTGEAVTKGAPDGYAWKDPADATKGVNRIPGFVPKPDPIEKAYQTARFADDNRTMKEVREQADAGRAQEANVTQLRRAREGVDYEGGPLQGIRTTLGKWLPDSVIPGVGLPFIPSQAEAGQAEQVQSLATDVQLGFVSKTKGAISNKEMELFGSATPGMGMSDAGAKRVMDGMEAGAARAAERGKFFSAWRAQNRSLDGAQEAWDSFVESNPVLVEDGKGSFSVNRDNIGNWRQYLSGAASSEPTSGPVPTPAGAPAASADTKVINGVTYTRQGGQWYAQ
jgi:hypothetical protein